MFFIVPTIGKADNFQKETYDYLLTALATKQLVNSIENDYGFMHYFELRELADFAIQSLDLVSDKTLERLHPQLYKDRTLLENGLEKIIATTQNKDPNAGIHHVGRYDSLKKYLHDHEYLSIHYPHSLDIPKTEQEIEKGIRRVFLRRVEREQYHYDWLHYHHLLGEIREQEVILENIVRDGRLDEKDRLHGIAEAIKKYQEEADIMASEMKSLCPEMTNIDTDVVCPDTLS